jgi:hypothetical protein
VQYFDCTWASQWGPHKARVSNLSPTGCYIDSRFLVPAIGETIEDITVDPSDAPPLALRGVVIDATRGIGFAVRFGELDADTRDRLRSLVRRGQPEPGRGL